MKIDRISYQKVFPIAQYVNEKIGVEIQLDPEDDPDDVYALAKRMVHGWHQQDTSSGAPLPSEYNNNAKALGPDVNAHDIFVPVSPQIPVINRREIERLEMLIDNATTLKQLEELLSEDGLPKELNDHYNRRWRELDTHK